MWEKYNTVELKLTVMGYTWRWDLPPGDPRPIQEWLDIELIADGAILLDRRKLQIELTEESINFR